jgi:hypothetical protein
MTNSSQREELARLIETMRDSQLSEQQHDRLQTLLRDDAELRRFYVQYQLLHVDLRTTLENKGTKRSNALSKSSSRNVRKRWWAVAAAVAAMMLGIFFGRQFDWEGDRGEVPAAASSSPAVAKLVAAMDARWSSGGSLRVGSQLPARPLKLESGLAEVRFASGASVVLQGPTECVLESPSHLKLGRGRLSANVPTEAVGFSVRTPVAAVVDLGTEFGVHSNEAGATDVHVFRGQVALGRPSGGGSRKELLDEGMAKHFKADGSQSEELPADELAFVSYQEFEARIRAEKNRPYYRWLAHSYQLRRDPSLIVYYSFDDRLGEEGRVRNRSGASAGRLDAQMGNGTDASTRPARTPSGRWPAQRALRFDASRCQHLRVEHANELNITQAVTVAAWIRPAIALMESEAVIMTKRPRIADETEPNYEFGLMRRADDSGKARCALYFHCGEHRVETADFVVTPGRWMHVAASAGAEGIQLFVDGEAAASRGEVDLVPNDGDLLIGSRLDPSPLSDTNKPASYEGLLGELMMFRRQLTSDEVHELFSVGKQEP